MGTKRKDDDGWVIRRLVPNAPRLKSRPRITSALNRDGLVQSLLAEIATGTSLTKLYAAMLAREIIIQDAKLARKYRHQLDELEE